MKDRRPARRLDHSEGEDRTHSVAYPFLLSFGLHLLLIGALVYIPMRFSTPRLPPGAISVSLVALPGPAPSAGAGDGGPAVEKPKPAEVPKPVEAPKPAPEKPAVPVAEPAPKPVPAVPKPEVSLAPPKVKEKKSLKEETKNPQKMIEQAIDRIEKKVKEPDSGSVNAAIDRIRKKLGEGEAALLREDDVQVGREPVGVGVLLQLAALGDVDRARLLRHDDHDGVGDRLVVVAAVEHHHARPDP